MIVYVDQEKKCHVAAAEDRTAVDSTFFDGKCDAFIEGYCFETLENGVHIYPWRSGAELEGAQREYEQQLLLRYEALIEALYEQAVTG